MVRNFSFYCALAAISLVIWNCGKDEEVPAVVEEAPTWESPETLQEEPPLESVGEAGSVPSEPLEPEPSYSPPTHEFSESGRYVVQVSVFKSQGMAQHLMEKLADRGFPAYVTQVENPTSELFGTYHRVRIGRFPTVSDARSFGDNVLQPLGYEFWVDNKSHDQMGYAELGGDSYGSTGGSDYGTSYGTTSGSDYGASSTSGTESWSGESATTGTGSNSWGESSSPSASDPIEPAATPEATTGSEWGSSGSTESSWGTEATTGTDAAPSAPIETAPATGGSDPAPPAQDDWSDWSTPSDTADEW